MSNKIKDDRYSVNIEFTGNFKHIKGLKDGQMYVARFCGEYIGSDETETKAWLTCIFHDDGRNLNILTV